MGFVSSKYCMPQTAVLSGKQGDVSPSAVNVSIAQCDLLLSNMAGLQHKHASFYHPSHNLLLSLLDFESRVACVCKSLNTPWCGWCNYKDALQLQASLHYSDA